MDGVILDNKKQYTLGEEIFNSVSHGAGALLAIAGCVVLIVFSAIYGGAWEVVSASIYGATLIILYTMSTLYHALTNPKAKRVFRILDHNILGITLNSVNLEKFKKFSMICYVAMGWAIVLAIKPLVHAIPLISTVFLLIGGVCYSIGIPFYKRKQTKYMHSIWHLFVIAGSVFHYFSVFFAIVH